MSFYESVPLLTHAPKTLIHFFAAYSRRSGSDHQQPGVTANLLAPSSACDGAVHASKRTR